MFRIMFIKDNKELMFKSNIKYVIKDWYVILFNWILEYLN